MIELEKWLADVFSCPDWLTILGIVGRTVLIYLVIVTAVRFLGTRELGRLNAYDFVLVVILANAVQNALVGGDNTLVGGLTSALTLLLMNLLCTWLLNRFPALERHVVGEPVVLVAGGRAHWDVMRREGVTRDELMGALREHGFTNLEDIRLAVLEVDGEISIVPRDSLVHRSRRHIRRMKAT